MFTLLVYSIFYIFYLIFGGFAFMFLQSNENNILFEEEVKSAKTSFLEKYAGISESALDSFIGQVLNSKALRLNATDNVDQSFGRSLFFATTLVTTIGYGQMAPMTTASKLFCIVYSAVGIPLTLILFTSVTDRLLVRSNRWMNYLIERFSFQCSELKIKMSYVSVLVALFSIVFMFIPAYIFSSVEPNWTYLDSFYFCFISITTIGLGDYIPAGSFQQNYDSAYNIIVSGYLIISLLCAMFVLKSFYAIPELNITNIVSLRFREPQYHKNTLEYQILFGKEDNSIKKLYSQDVDTTS